MISLNRHNQTKANLSIFLVIYKCLPNVIRQTAVSCSANQNASCILLGKQPTNTFESCLFFYALSMIKISHIVCKIIGHKRDIEEVYAKRHDSKYSYRRPFFSVYSDTKCSRCGTITEREVLAYGLSKRDMLNYNWFIEKK